MSAVARHAAAADYSGVTLPGLFLFSPDDQVVSPARTARVAARWGGPVTVEEVKLGAGDDPYAHVVAGDVLSPSMTGPLAERILAWARGL